jgi:hypothetical protein
VQPSQDKRRPAQRTRPRTSTPRSSRGAPGPASGGSTGLHTWPHRNRGRTDREGTGHRTYLISRTRVLATERGVSKNEGEGRGSNLALFKTEGYISARRDSLSAREIVPMEQHNRVKAMPSSQYCVQQEFLRPLARFAGVNAVSVRAVGKNRYHLSALIQGKTQE